MKKHLFSLILRGTQIVSGARRKIETAASKVSPELNWVLPDFKCKNSYFRSLLDISRSFQALDSRLQRLHQKSAQN